MPNFAVLQGQNIINVIAAESKTIAEEVMKATCIQFEETDSAEPGGMYIDGIFIKAKPYLSWILNTNNQWEAPIPYPEVDLESPKYYQWNEKILNWEEVQVSE